MLEGLHPLGVRFRQHRSALGLTMADQADEVGCLASTISAIERGARTASEEYICRCAAWLKLTDAETQELLRLTNAKPTASAQSPPVQKQTQLTFDFENAPYYYQIQQFRKRLIKSAPGSRSDQELRQIATVFLDCLGLRNKPFLDLLDIIENKLYLADQDYYLHIYPNCGDELPAYSEAHGDVAKRIVLSDHAYAGLRKADAELNFLAAHELAHWLLHAETLNYSHKQQPAEIEANKLAVEILLPRDTVRRFNTAGQLAMTRRVPLKTAHQRMEDLKLGPYRKKKQPSIAKLSASQTQLQSMSYVLSPTCFISYAWEAEDHKNWILKLAKALQENGVYVRLDQWDIGPGTILPHYIEESIRESSYVLLVCTPTFARKANAGKGGVGYEKTIVSAEIFEAASDDALNSTKFIPVLKYGSSDEAIPSYLKSRTYVDMRDDTCFDLRLEELLRHIYGTPALSRPPLGTKPHFVQQNYDPQVRRT